jgi:hypothetical protein
MQKMATGKSHGVPFQKYYGLRAVALAATGAKFEFSPAAGTTAAAGASVNRLPQSMIKPKEG